MAIASLFVTTAMSSSVMLSECILGLFNGVGVRPGKRYDSCSKIPRDELDGEDCKAKE